MKYIAHGSLPEGIPEITTPNRILADVENANKNDNGDDTSETAVLAVAKTTARIYHQGGKERIMVSRYRLIIFLSLPKYPLSSPLPPKFGRNGHKNV